MLNYYQTTSKGEKRKFPRYEQEGNMTHLRISKDFFSVRRWKSKRFFFRLIPPNLENPEKGLDPI
jgi:hypothetical protein